MENQDLNEPKKRKKSKGKKVPVYEPPKIVTYTEEEIQEQIGPAHACSPSPCGID